MLNALSKFNKALYIIGNGERGGVVVAWHYDGTTLGIANVILAC